MREVKASEANSCLVQLLEEVERGEIIVITRRGRRIARIVPEAAGAPVEGVDAIESIKALRKRTGKVAIEDLLSGRHDGHKY